MTNGRKNDAMYPSGQAVAVTPNDGADLPGGPCRGLYVGASGDVSVILERDTSPVVLTGLAAGVVHPLFVKRVRVTGTTATGIVALY